MSDADPMTEAAVCAVHPGQPAYTTCARCGNYACSYCLGDRDLCGSCVARDEGGVISWERKDLSLPVRFWRTTRDVITRPVHALGEQRAASTAAAVGYAVLVCSLPVGVLLLVACVGAGVWLVPAGQAIGPSEGLVLLALLGVATAALPVAVLAITVVRAGFFHVAARALGGNGSFESTFRASSYMNAFFLVSSVGGLLGSMPVLGIAITLAMMVLELLWAGNALSGVARARYGLDGTRALVAGFLPGTVYAIAVLVVILVVVLGGLLGAAPDAYAR